jgi:predicted secreted protein
VQFSVAELGLTEQDANTTVDVHVGDTVAIRLPERPGSGYRWTVAPLDERLVGVAASDFAQAPASGVGGGGLRTIRLTARGAGVARVALENRRAWEPHASPVAQFTVTLQIDA